MKRLIFSVLYVALSFNCFTQSIDDAFSQKKMRKDLELFKEIREQANSGLYKYRTREEIDSIYDWADKRIDNASTYRDFYNIICQLTDFEGSSHNSTRLPEKIVKNLRKESTGYFPYPIKYIENKWIVNYDGGAIPLGAEILSINQNKMEHVIRNLNIYFTTDGYNTTGKRIGIEPGFGKFYRFYYGLNHEFKVDYREQNSDKIRTANLNSIGYKNYYKNVNNRYSKPFDNQNYKDWEESEAYDYEVANNHIAILTINTFGLGNEEDPRHACYLTFLDSIFLDIKQKNLKNLIVDVRYNGGGDNPNDLVTYSYLTNRKFQENKKAWISFRKIPYLKHNINSSWPYLIKLLGVGKYNRHFQKEFPKEIDGKYYQDQTSGDHKSWTPNQNAFHGNVYLLISPRIASAGSLFAAMLAGNENTTVIGEETMGGYFGHNGHVNLAYRLPQSKLEIGFFVVNLEQDVPNKSNQIYGRGIIPDYEVSQTYEDYLCHEDRQMAFTLELIDNLRKHRTK